MNGPSLTRSCMKLAALHVREMILTDKDMDKQLVTLTLRRYGAACAHSGKSETYRQLDNFLFSAEYNVVGIRSLLKDKTGGNQYGQLPSV